ncbi:hypothetical protein A3K63_04010 [Candidatus Micrarchaeota archaeon RBG_16_49_10]|nr:MAG: hypothetical protein A3K63_04010 [Candidatus Micrarchaeota archaeon RBG_16_49_10]
MKYAVSLKESRETILNSIYSIFRYKGEVEPGRDVSLGPELADDFERIKHLMGSVIPYYFNFDGDCLEKLRNLRKFPNTTLVVTTALSDGELLRKLSGI